MLFEIEKGMGAPFKIFCSTNAPNVSAARTKAGPDNNLRNSMQRVLFHIHA